MSFTITITAVITMLLYAVPAFILGKAKMIKQEGISAFATILLYVCTPAIILHAFSQIKFSKETLISVVIFFFLSLAIQALAIFVAWLILRKKMSDAKYRIATIACSFGNCGFFGIPLLKSLLPDNPEALVCSSLFSISMNFLAFTIASLIITGDKKYISLKKAVLNPAVIPLFIAIPLFFFNLAIPSPFDEMLEVLTKISTPICMFVLGFRLSTVKIKELFGSSSVYISIFAKQIIMPFLAILITRILPCDPILETAFILISGCPVASVVLNLSELIGKGQKEAANSVLLGTLFSIITIPLITLFI